MREDEAIDLVKKVKKKRPDKAEEWAVHTEPGEMGRMIQNAMTIYNLPAIDTNDNAQVSQRIGEYFQICEQREMKPSLSGMAMALGVDRETVRRWAAGAIPSKPKDVCGTVKRAYQILNFMIEEYMQNGKINPVSGIFLMKNNFGYADKSEVVVTPNNPLGDAESRESIEARYREAIAAPDESVEATYVEVPETDPAIREGEDAET